MFLGLDIILNGTFFKANTSLQVRHNNLLLLTINSSFGYDFTYSNAEICLGSPFSFPLPVLTPLGGGFCLRCPFLDKSTGVGDLRRSSKQMTVGEPDCRESEVHFHLAAQKCTFQWQHRKLSECKRACA